MSNAIDSVRNKKASARSMMRFVIITNVILVMLLLNVLCPYYLNSCRAEDTSYIPAPPSGPNVGFVTIDYEYTIFTTNPESSWMFDWDDGTTSSWLSVPSSETSIVQSHRWDSAAEYHVRVEYRSTYFEEGVWSTPLTITINVPADNDFPESPQFVAGPRICCQNVSYSYSLQAVDPLSDALQYRCDWGDETISSWSYLVASGAITVLSHKWMNPGTFSVRSQTRDVYGLLSIWSNPINVTVEEDSDGDGLSNVTELKLGLNKNDPTDARSIVVHGISHFIIFPGNQILFYNSTSGLTNAVKVMTDGTYLIDDDSNGKWDYVYNLAQASLVPYEEKPSNKGISLAVPWWLLVVIGIIIIVILIVFYLFKTGRIYVYEEYVVEE